MPDFLKLNKQKLKTLDVLTYVTVRSFHNSKTGKCYPSYEKIMQRSGLSRGTVAASIKRLEASGHFKVNHSNRQGTCNQYEFGDLKHFHRIPYEIFDAHGLTIYEKAFLLCLRSMFMNGLLLYSGSIKSLAEGLGLTYQQVYKPYKSLVAKGYITEKGTSKVYIFLDPKINWEYHYQSNKLPPDTTPFLMKVA